MGESEPDGTLLQRLTEKQREVLDLLLQHMTSKEIARTLGISPHTVDQRIKFAKDKLGVSSRSELAVAYVKLRSIYEPMTYEESHIAALSIPAQIDGRNDEQSVDPPKPQERMQIEDRAEQPNDYRVVPGIFEGRFGTLARLVAIALLALLSIFIALGGLALFSTASQFWAN